MEIYREEAIRISPMYHIGIETNREKERLIGAIECALIWGGFTKEKDEERCYFSEYKPSVNAAIVSTVMGVPMSAIISDMPIAITARKIICYMSSKNNTVDDISSLLLTSHKRVINMINQVQQDIDNQNGYTIRLIEKIMREFENYISDTI